MAEHNIEMPEEWRPVPFPEYAEIYEVSNLGRVRKILKTWINDSGHVRMVLCRNDTVTNIYVHRLVAMTFISPPPSPYHEVAHRNGKAADNRIANLRWVTSAENKEDNRINGTMVVGEQHYKAKLSAEMVSEIRALYALGGISHEQLAERFGVHRVHIGAIIAGKTWRHVGRIVDPTAAVDTEDAPEEWRPVPFPDFSDTYLVSSHGRCARLLKAGLSGPGRNIPLVILAKNGKNTTQKVHRLVALAFLGPPPTPKHLVAHWDGNPQNNHVTNLRWATDGENKADARRHGTMAIGEHHGQAKLTEAQAREIHALWATGTHSQREIGAMYGVARTSVGDIIRGRNWGHLGLTKA